MKKFLLKKLKSDFKKAGFELKAINFIVSYKAGTITTEGEQTNGNNIKKTEPLKDNSALIDQLTAEVKKQIDFDVLDIVVLKCDLETFEVKAELFYHRAGQPLKKELDV